MLVGLKKAIIKMRDKEIREETLKHLKFFKENQYFYLLALQHLHLEEN